MKIHLAGTGTRSGPTLAGFFKRGTKFAEGKLAYDGRSQRVAQIKIADLGII